MTIDVTAVEDTPTNPTAPNDPNQPSAAEPAAAEASEPEPTAAREADTPSHKDVEPKKEAAPALLKKAKRSKKIISDSDEN